MKSPKRAVSRARKNWRALRLVRCSPTRLSTCGGVSASDNGRNAASIACQIKDPALFHRALLVS